MCLLKLAKVVPVVSSSSDIERGNQEIMSLRNVFENDHVSPFPIPYVRFLNTTSPVIRVGLDPLVQFGCVTVFDERSKPNDSFGAPKVDVSLVLAPSNDMPKTFFVIAPYQTVVSNHPSAVIAKIVIEYILAIPQAGTPQPGPKSAASRGTKS